MGKAVTAAAIVLLLIALYLLWPPYRRGQRLDR